MCKDAEYAKIAKPSLERLAWVLMKLDSDRRTGTEYFSNNFVGKIKSAFLSLPKPAFVEKYNDGTDNAKVVSGILDKLNHIKRCIAENGHLDRTEHRKGDHYLRHTNCREGGIAFFYASKNSKNSICELYDHTQLLRSL